MKARDLSQNIESAMLLSKLLPKFKGKEAFIRKTQINMAQRKKDRKREKRVLDPLPSGKSQR